MAQPHPFLSQAGVIPVQANRVCLVTSRTHGRWTVPKGMIDPGYSPQEAALQEAWEEAGLRGNIAPAAVGIYRYQKYGRTHEVQLFRLEVTEIDEDWPECAQRQRRWFTAAEIREQMEDSELWRLVLLVLADTTTPEE